MPLSLPLLGASIACLMPFFWKPPRAGSRGERGVHRWASAMGAGGVCWWEPGRRLHSRQTGSFSFDYAMSLRGAWVCSSAFLCLLRMGMRQGVLVWGFKPRPLVF